MKALRMAGFFITALVFFASFPAWPQVKLPDGGWRHYRVVELEKKKEGAMKISSDTEDLSSFASHLYPSSYKNKPVYYLDKEDKTVHGDKIIWRFYMSPESMGLFRIDKKVVSRSGKVVKESYTDYIDPMFDFPENTCHMYTIIAMIMSKGVKVGDRFDISLLLNEDSRPWHMWVVAEAEEKVKVPAGSIDCVRVKLEPDYKSILGRWAWTSAFIKQFVPEYIFWMEKAAPHPLVCFEGGFGPVGGSPPQRYELTLVQ